MFTYFQYCCKIRHIDLPLSIQGFTVYTDGLCTIYINNKLDEASRIETIMHELKHLENGDFILDNGSVSDIEHRMHA